MIGEDQACVRENMKALRGSADEKPLLQRYTRQLDAQETRLETLRQDTTKATAARQSADQELARTIADLSFELAGASNTDRNSCRRRYLGHSAQPC